MIPESASLCRAQPAPWGGPADAASGWDGVGLTVAPALADDARLLRGIDYWLSLGAAPADQGRLGAQLIGWACFPAGPWFFVARLQGAGQHGGAFTHARAWPLGAASADFDPGLYLGEDAAFLAAPLAPGEPLPDHGLAPPDPAGIAPALADPGLVTALIAHLFHGLLQGLPVILAVPPGAFAAGTPLARTVALARGALPARLRRRCRVRVFSREPAHFLVAQAGTDAGCIGAADLLVIPEDLAAGALGAVHRCALLLDGGGERHDGPPPAAGLVDYARAVVGAACRLPGHLTRFGERFDALWPESDSPPGPDLTDWVTLTCNLAAALAAGPAACAGLLGGYLLNLARENPRVPWSRLVAPGDWTAFPQEALVRLLLRPADDQGPGERALQGALEDAFQRLGARVDGGLAAWWDPADGPRRRRLLELAAREPPLVSAGACAALTAPLALADLGVAAAAGLLRRLLAGSDWPGREDLVWHLVDRLRGDPEGLTALAADLFDAAGGLRIAATGPLAVRLLGTPVLADRLACADLVRLGAVLPQGDGAALAGYQARLDTLMVQDPVGTTAHLIRAGAWLAWRRAAGGRLGPRERHRHALVWLTSPAFVLFRADAARRRPPQWRPPRPPDAGPPAVVPDPLPDVTRETWDQVVADLGPLTPDEAELLCAPQTRWPWLYPYRAEQVRDLTACCRDPESRARVTAV